MKDWYDKYRKQRDNLNHKGFEHSLESDYNFNHLIYNCYEAYRYKTGESQLSPISSGTGMTGDTFYHPENWINEFIDKIYAHVDSIITMPNGQIFIRDNDKMYSKTVVTTTLRFYSAEEFIEHCKKYAYDKGVYLYTIAKVKMVDRDSYEVRVSFTDDDMYAKRKRKIKKRRDNLDDLLN